MISDFGKRIDLLAIDSQGDLFVIELKKDRTPREVVAQTLESGFWAQGLSFEAVRELYAKHHEGQTSTWLSRAILKRIFLRRSIPATSSL